MRKIYLNSIIICLIKFLKYNNSKPVAVKVFEGE